MRKLRYINIMLVVVLCVGCGSLIGTSEKTEHQNKEEQQTQQEMQSEQTEEVPETVPENLNSEITQQVPERNRICEYTNMADKDTQDFINEILEVAGVSKQRRNNFFEHVNQYNESVHQAVLHAGFVKGDILNVPYDPYDLQEQWILSHPDFIGYNCRITSYGLFADFLSIDEESESRDQDLFMDIEALEADSSVLLDEKDKERFLRFFSVVPTQATKDINIHVKNILQDWEERNIRFLKNTRMDLVTVWFHNQWSENENELFIGHTGVLVYGKDALYFIEKVAFQEPYQVVKFDTKKQLHDYLIEKYDIAWGQDTAAVFVLNNDKLLSD